jgi:hypothetical protein
MLRFTAFMIFVMFLTFSNKAGEFVGYPAISRCVIEVDDVTYLDEPRYYAALTNRGGSFGIFGPHGPFLPGSFAWVEVADGEATAHWNGPDQDASGDMMVEHLRREGACWTNATARFCAYRYRPAFFDSMEERLTRMFKLGLVFIAVSLMAVPAQGDKWGGDRDLISRCVIEVGGVTYMDEPCHYTALANRRGSFGISAGGDAFVSGVFAWVDVSDGEAIAHWNGPDRHQHSDVVLDDLQRDGACWVSETARVCAYR